MDAQDNEAGAAVDKGPAVATAGWRKELSTVSSQRVMGEELRRVFEESGAGHTMVTDDKHYALANRSLNCPQLWEWCFAGPSILMMR